jgi:hypothetical protein
MCGPSKPNCGCPTKDNASGGNLPSTRCARHAVAQTGADLTLVGNGNGMAAAMLPGALITVTPDVASYETLYTAYTPQGTPMPVMYGGTFATLKRAGRP